ncbi:MAG: hypothetical protein AB1668_01360 [Nanoarchaeota archaeon]
MELFMPSQRVLEAICWNESAYRQYITLPAKTPEYGSWVDGWVYFTNTGFLSETVWVRCWKREFIKNTDDSLGGIAKFPTAWL